MLPRLINDRNSSRARAIWDVAMFCRAPKGDDRWILQWNNLLIRSHGRARTRAFHPLHRSTPLSLESLSTRRVTILFPIDSSERQAKVDAWSQNLPLFRGQWNCFTVL